MKTNFIFIFISMFLIPIWGMSQASVDNNNPFTGAFLGWNGAQNLDFRTNNINRMRLMQTGTNTINSYTVANDGFLMLSMDPAVFGVEEPFSLLHLNGADNNLVGPQQLGYRSWMRAGITFTHNSDMMFVGPMRTAGTDRTDAVISWSDNDQPGGTVGPDVLRFLFTGAGNGTTTVSSDPLSNQDWDGVETARIMGDARMGVGPLWTNSLLPKRALDVIRRNDAEPQFRLTYNPGTTNDAGTYTDFQTSSQGNLHIRPRINTSTKTTAIGFLAGQGGFANPSPGTTLDVGGITRVRNLPDSIAKSLIIGFQPSQLTQSTEDQFLGRLDFLGDTCLVLNSNGSWTDVCNLGGGSGGADLDWEFNGTNVWTGHNQNNYPGGGVFIGANTSPFNSKVYFQRSGAQSDITMTNGLAFRWQPATEAQGQVNGIIGEVTSNSPLTSHGINILSTGGQNSYAGVPNFPIAILGRTFATQPTTRPIGLVGLTSGGNKGVAVYGMDMSGGNAGYFAGSVVVNGPSLQISDETIKDNFELLEDASSLLSQLEPYSYNFRDEEFPYLNLKEGQAYGFKAQDVQEILPNLVQEVTQPATFDSLGNVATPQHSMLALSYTEFIPILVAGFKEQRAVIDAQQAELEAMQTEMAAMSEAAMITESGATLSDLEAQLAAQQEQINLLMEQLAACCAAPIGTPGAGSDKSMNGDATPTDQLHQNIPNPFKEQTTINFELVSDSQVLLEITDAQGNLVATLVNGSMARGQHRVEWNASGQARGTYFYSLYTDKELLTKKMIKL